MNIDLLMAFEQERAVLDFIWPGFLAGTVGALIAIGAMAKSFWVLEAAMSIEAWLRAGKLDTAPVQRKPRGRPTKFEQLRRRMPRGQA